MGPRRIWYVRYTFRFAIDRSVFLFIPRYTASVAEILTHNLSPIFMCVFVWVLRMIERFVFVIGLRGRLKMKLIRFIYNEKKNKLRLSSSPVCHRMPSLISMRSRFASTFFFARSFRLLCVRFEIWKYRFENWDSFRQKRRILPYIICLYLWLWLICRPTVSMIEMIAVSFFPYFSRIIFISLVVAGTHARARNISDRSDWVICLHLAWFTHYYRDTIVRIVWALGRTNERTKKNLFEMSQRCFVLTQSQENHKRSITAMCRCGRWSHSMYVSISTLFVPTPLFDSASSARGSIGIDL